MGPSNVTPNFSYTYAAVSSAHSLDEHPLQAEPVSDSLETIPVSAFAHASTMQAIARYLVDIRGLSFTEAAKKLGRNPKSIWTSYHQATPLPVLDSSIAVPLRIFTSHLPPLEALVTYLKSNGLRNVEISSLLHLSQKTIWTAAKRGEGRQ